MPRIKKEKPPKPPKAKVTRKHSEATRALISERRRARTVQPRNVSQSAKSLSFYSELLKDYKVIDKKLSPRQKKQMEDAQKWIEQNKHDLGHIDNVNDFRMLEPDYERWGILTEYKEMYCNEYEEKVSDMIYSEERTPMNNNASNDPYDMVENLDDFNNIFGVDFDE